MAQQHLFRTEVIPQWLDYNGHVRDSYHTVIFSDAVDTFMEAIGVDEAYRKRTRKTLYTLELHTIFLKELLERTPLQVETQLLAVDHKRLHLWQGIRNLNDQVLHTVQEAMMLHVSQEPTPPRSEPFPGEIQQRVDSWWQEHRELPNPSVRASCIGLRR
jgi:acyl-CoA thioester hydrolase